MDCAHGDSDSDLIVGIRDAEREVVAEEEVVTAKEAAKGDEGGEVEVEVEVEPGSHEKDKTVVKNQSTDESAHADADQLLGGAPRILHIDPPICPSSSSPSSLSVPVPLIQEHPYNLSQQFDAQHYSPLERRTDSAIGGHMESLLLMRMYPLARPN